MHKPLAKTLMKITLEKLQYMLKTPMLVGWLVSGFEI